MTHCTGLIGKRCTCGLYHAPGGMTVERGWESDHCEDKPIVSPEEAASMVASGSFWLGGFISVVLWAALIWIVLHSG